MPRLIACTSCQTHVRSSEAVCPHCGAVVPNDGGLVRTASAVLMGLTMAGCGPEPGNGTASEGMSASEGTSTSEGTSASDPGTTGSVSNGSQDSGGSSTGSADETWGDPQPEYGVPDTGWYEETDDTGGESTDDTSGDSTGSTGSTGGAQDTGGGADDGPIDTGAEPLYGVGDSG